MLITVSFSGVGIEGSEVMDEGSARAPAEEMADAAEEDMFQVVESLTRALDPVLAETQT